MGFGPETYEFFGSAIDVWPMYTDRKTHLVRYMDDGVMVTQPQGTNWFHFSLVSPTLLDDDDVGMRAAYLRCHCFGGVWIMASRICESQKAEPVELYRKDYSQDPTDANFIGNFTEPGGASIGERMQLACAVSHGDAVTDKVESHLLGFGPAYTIHRVTGALVLSVEVSFEREGMVRFCSVGGLFEEFP